MSDLLLSLVRGPVLGEAAVDAKLRQKQGGSEGPRSPAHLLSAQSPYLHEHQ